MNQTELTRVALFPIPGVVAFPGTIVPLHVFEPRYRSMINESVQANRMIAVCHTRKVIRPAPKQNDITVALNSNQATYQPCGTFSAGYCEILEVLDDGRLHVSIEMVKRLTLVDEVQTLPYRIVDARELIDQDVGEAHAALQVSVNNRLINIVGGQNPALARMLQQQEWQNQSAAKFSFRIFQFLKFDPDLMQELLEMQNIGERLKLIDQLLSEPG